ncbi:hypothetical protein [Enhygromyxa salina]|uniref:hypothetical protein n=1 Tax=Enhygromyxa salina TaxID=215803 RepID=UPI0015E62530|nr:hypothetical protein [Enhygromyxa salina]
MPITVASAGPPPAPPSSTQAEGEDALPPAIVDAPSGFWLSVELIGPRGAQIDAARALAQPPVVDALPRGGAPPPGELVGRVDTLDQALTWVNANSFAAVSDNGDATAVPGGRLYADHGLFLTALVVTAEVIGGAQPYAWPPAGALPLPPDVDWQPASLAVARAPVFAAPSPSLPPASERYQVVDLDDSLWLLESQDRCEDPGLSSVPPTCLRWARILVRRGERFFGGWVPAAHVIPDSAWVGGPGERRFALLPGHRGHDEVGFVLLEQRGERREGPVGLVQAHAGDTWPAASVEVLGEELVVLIAGQPALTRHISADPLAP